MIRFAYRTWNRFEKLLGKHLEQVHQLYIKKLGRKYKTYFVPFNI